MRQRDLAALLGVETDTVTSWELGNAQPLAVYLPRILAFLGRDPRPAPKKLSDRIRAARTALGLTQRQMAARLGIDPTTLGAWEVGRHRPTRASLRLLEQLLKPEGK